MKVDQLSSRKSRKRALILPGMMTLIGIFILVGLGTWQLQRLSWKEDLISKISERIHTQPLAVPSEDRWAQLDLSEEEYRPVFAEGIYRYDQQVYVHGNASFSKSGVRMGYFVLTPLEQADGSLIVINRGFIPMELRKDKAAFQEWLQRDQKPDLATVIGLLRRPQERGWFVPADKPEEGEWFTRDPQALAQAANLKRVAPFLIDASAQSQDSWPRGGLTILSFPNKHLDYALTWFGLAVALLIIFVVFSFRQLQASDTLEG